jgi:hypothetical protein
VPDAALLAFLEVDELLVDVSSLSGVDLKQAMHAVHNTHTQPRQTFQPFAVVQAQLQIGDDLVSFLHNYT